MDDNEKIIVNGRLNPKHAKALKFVPPPATDPKLIRAPVLYRSIRSRRVYHR